jgi:hypothetical protein
MPSNENICPHCGGKRTLVVLHKCEKIHCEKCDADPMHSPKINNLLAAAALKPPLGSRRDN